MSLSEQEIRYNADDVNFLSQNYKKAACPNAVFEHLVKNKKTLVSNFEIKKDHQYTFNVFSIENVVINKDIDCSDFSFRMGILLVKKGKIISTHTCPKMPSFIIPKTFTIQGEELQESGNYELHFFSFPENYYDLFDAPLNVHLSFSTEVKQLA